MNELYKNIIELCNAKHIKPGKMCDETGISRALISDLKYGRKSGASAKTLDKIAKYFDVSVEYLIGTANCTENRTVEMLQSMRDVDRALMEGAREANEEDVRAALAYLNYLKENRND